MIQSIIGTSFTGGGGGGTPPSTPTFVANNYNPLEGTTITFTISGITGVSEGTFLYWWIDGTSGQFSRANQFVENIDNDTLQLYTDGSGTLGGTFTLTPNQGDISFNIYIGYGLYSGFLNLSQNITVTNVVTTFLTDNYEPLEGTTITFTISGITGVSEGTFLYWWIDGTSGQFSRADQFVENIDNDTLQLYNDGSGTLGGTFTLTPNQGDIDFNIYIGYSLYGGFLNLPSDITVKSDVNDFTIEWWQKMETSVGLYDVLFSVGNNLRFSEQLEGNNLTILTGNSVTGIANQNIPGLYNTWVHFAIVRSSNIIKLYKNGTSLLSFANNSLIQNNSDVLQIAKQTNPNNYFQGYITNFHFLKGVSKYNNNFTPSTTSLNLTDFETKLLLSVTSSNTAFIDRTGNHVAYVIGGTWSSESPFSDGSGSLYFDGSSYLGFPGSNDWAIDKPYELALTFDDILNVNFIDDPNNVSDWNTYFDLPNLGSTFDSVQVNGDTVTLLGRNITLRDQIFDGRVSLISVIDEGCIVSAGNSCFNGCTNLTSISLPALTTAGNSCFNGCTNLTSISLPALTSTDNNFFKGCTNLTSISLPALTTASSAMFDSCTNLTSISLPALTTAGNAMFIFCTSLNSISIPLCTNLGETTSYDSMFYGITGNTMSMTLNQSVIQDFDLIKLSFDNTLIVNGTTYQPFSGYSGDLTISFNNITDANNLVGDATQVSDWNTFFDMPLWSTPFTSVLVSGSNITLSGGENIGLKNIFMYNNLTGFNDTGCICTLDLYCFRQCGNLSTINFSLLEIINTGTFFSCSGLTSISLPKVISIKNSSFSGCISLTSISIPLVTTLENFAFSNCTNLTSVSLPQLITMESLIFSYCTNLTTISLPISSAGHNCFNECTSLTSVSLPQLTTIGWRSFRNCSLTSIYLPLCNILGGNILGDTVDNNEVFQGITGKTIALTIPSALMTCNSGQPDGDIQYLQANNTVTITQV